MVSEHFELTAPFASIRLNHRPKHWKLITAAWMVFWVGVLMALAYAYVNIIPGVIGFQKTVLIGILMIFLGVGTQ